MKDAIIEFAAKLANEAAADRFFADMPDRSPAFTVTFGRKYGKVISMDRDGNHRSVWGFVDMVTGDLFKAAGWSKPAKHSRGNIATAAYGPNYSWTGPNYLR